MALPFRLFLLPVFGLLAFGLPVNAAPSAIVTSSFINEGAPYPECHASTLAEISPGHFAASWFGGTKERAPDVGIWVALGDGTHWNPAVEVANGIQPAGKRLPTWNPVLFQIPHGPLLLFYKVGPSPGGWWGMMTSSMDGGKTWTERRRLPAGILGPIKDKPVLLGDGTLLCPASTEGTGGWQVHFEFTRDAGATWSASGPVASTGELAAIQPSVVFYGQGAGARLQAICRTRNGVLASTWSSDQGKTWTPLAAMSLPNPNSGVDAVTLADGRQFLVYNNTAPPPERPTKGLRYPLDVAVSTDGLAWHHVLTLEDQPSGNGYSYPAVIQSSDGLVRITYTWNRKHIKYVVLDPRAL